MTSASPESLEHLLQIQDRDKSIAALRHQKSNLPERQEIADLLEALSTLQKKKDFVSKELISKEDDQQRLEDEVNAIEERVSEQEANLYSGEVSAIKDLQAIQGDIAGLQERKRLVEDQIIVVMEQIEPLKTLFDQLEIEEKTNTEQQAELEAALLRKEQSIEKQIEDVEAERSELALDTSPALLEIYEKIRKQSGNIAVAQLNGMTCKGCHLDLPAVEVDRLKKLPPDQLVHCEECGCILVR
jgi:predicted  nucleic acid-binding Zn-ribbon protein|tara:strand:+ start:3687 stop:4415 length:729 start_codon:yes stop_codon:yes gene_type:complete